MDWSIYNERGTKEVVIKKITENPKLPESAKRFLLGEIEALPADCVGASVNAYGQTHEREGHHEVTRTIQATVIGIRL